MGQADCCILQWQDGLSQWRPNLVPRARGEGGGWGAELFFGRKGAHTQQKGGRERRREGGGGGFDCALHLRMARRSWGEGTPTSSSRSNRPGRLRALSTASGRFVAAMITTLLLVSDPEPLPALPCCMSAPILRKVSQVLLSFNDCQRRAARVTSLCKGCCGSMVDPMNNRHLGGCDTA